MCSSSGGMPTPLKVNFDCSAYYRLMMYLVGFVVANVLLFVFAFLFEGLLSYRARLDQHIAYTQNFPADPKRVRYVMIRDQT